MAKMIVNLQFADLYGGGAALSASDQLDQKNPQEKTLLNCLMGRSRLQPQLNSYSDSNSSRLLGCHFFYR